MPDLPWFVYAMLLAPLGLLLGVAVYKTLQVRAAREWPSTPGKVVVSSCGGAQGQGDRQRPRERARFEERNFANIVYEYSVSGNKLRNNRVSIGEDLGNFEVAETIAKYPVGSIVTVYYNPRHPREAVLERDLPKGLWGCLGIGTAIALAVLFGAMIGFKRISEFAGAHLANPQASVPVVALAAFGLVAALFALVWRKQSALAKTWPVVPGTIKLSGLDEYRAAPSEDGARGVDHVRAQGVLCLPVQRRRLYRRARQLLKQFPDAPRHGCCGCSEWIFRTAPASRSGSIRKIHRRRRSIRARVSAGCCGCSHSGCGRARI